MSAANSLAASSTNGSSPPAWFSFAFDVGGGQRFRHLGAQARKDGLGRARRREQAEPDRDLVARIELADRGQVGELAASAARR